MPQLAEYLAYADTIPTAPLGVPGRYGMTPGQQRLYRYLARIAEPDGIVLHHSAWGAARPVSVEEIRVAIGCVSKGSVARMLDALAERGWLTRERIRHRSIRLTQPIMRSLRPVGEGA